jgi:hypothetical protein
MRAVVVYESMYGNTHVVAEAIADGLGLDDVAVVPVGRASDSVAAGVDLLVVGGPTHVHGMSRESTRRAAAEAARSRTGDVVLDPDAEGDGLREWFDRCGPLGVRAAAFDTRVDASAFVTGRASKGIARRLEQHACTLLADPMSFLVTKRDHLTDGEAVHARAWGAELRAALLAARGDVG